jgi:hypothetical protein
MEKDGSFKDNRKTLKRYRLFRFKQQREIFFGIKINFKVIFFTFSTL